MGQLGDAMTEKEIGKIIDYLSIKGCFNNSFKGYAKMYAMTTENISGFLNKHDLKDKRVLTVAGSGDQRYNCYLRGAREVICFDNNPLAELNMRLKDTAMQELEYTDFLKFFGVILDKNEGNNILDSTIFNKFKKHLDKDVYLFYDYLINKFNRPILRNVYEEFTDNYSKLREFDDYIVKSNFKKLVNIMSDKDINFLNVNVDNLAEALDGEKFDIILLSNISDYIHFIYPDDNHMERYKKLVNKLVDNLYDGGILQLGYVYAKYDECRRYDDVSKFRFDNSRNKYFPFNKYLVEFVHSYDGGRRYDKVITYQKKR